jgi:hypothetical protein
MERGRTAAVREDELSGTCNKHGESLFRKPERRQLAKPSRRWGDIKIDDYLKVYDSVPSLYQYEAVCWTLPIV